MILRLFDRDIDITNYVDSHPGGRAILKRSTQSKSDASSAFLAAGHSSDAMKIVDTLSLVNRTDPPMQTNHPVDRTTWQTIKHRLFTHEDYRHLHKLSGLVALVHFLVCLYRFGTSGARARSERISVVQYSWSIMASWHYLVYSSP